MKRKATRPVPNRCITPRDASAGQRFAITDLLIARLADEIGALVWSLDSDFERLARLKFVNIYG